MPESVLNYFHPHVARWFQDVFATPTSVQTQAWQSISQGENCLVIAPTGAGKTLAAFLWALNTLSQNKPERVHHNVIDRAKQVSPNTPSVPSDAHHGVHTLYISPLKALGVDVEQNLRVPLLGMSRTAERMGIEVPEITVGVRSGDTTSAERARLLRQPPDILITTPESLYLMLTSKAAGTLRGVHTVIIDEIHALAGSKRGVHLALSLERLAHLAGDFQRIGLSATVRPAETVAEFLGGDRPVTIVNPPADKKWQLDVHVPVPNMSDLPAPELGSTIGEFVVDDPLGLSQLDAPTESALPAQNSIWPFLEKQLYQETMQARSTLVFVNSRRTAERLTSRINELYAAEHQPEALSPTLRRDPAQIMKSVDVAGVAPTLIARAHHGSVSKEERALTERLLKEGELKAVIATSSLELGIDMGAVDLVVQVEAPPSVASALQRVGRAGHSVGAVSVGSFYPKHRADVLDTAVIVEGMREGAIEKLHPPHNALDILVQQTVAAVAVADWNVEEWYTTVRRAYPYRELPREVFDSVIDLAAGVYPSTDFADLRPRLTFDREKGLLSARPGAQRVAVTSGGTIPDRGMFGVFLLGGGEGARRVGELDEEMVYESRPGDVFTLGASSWRIAEITRDQVLVTPAPGHTGRLPFWNGDQPGRPAELGQAVGAFRRRVLASAVEHPEGATEALQRAGLDTWAADNVVDYLLEQREATGLVPDEKTLVMERFKDELGDWRVVLHSPFGKGVNAAWALAVGARIAENTGIDAQPVSGDDGIVLRIPEGEEDPAAELFVFEPEDIRRIVTQQVGNSALFAARFRECAARALLLPRRNPGKRAPLWQQRQRAAQLLDVARKYPSFPIILETVRECIQDVYDVPALEELCRDLRASRVRIAEVTTQQPSPFAASLLFSYTGAFMYEADTPLAEKRAAALALDPTLLAKLLGTVELRELLDADVIAAVHAELQYTAAGRQARTAEELADQLRVLGPIPVAELDQHVTFADPLGVALRDLGQRVMVVRIAGVEHLAQQLDAALLRDGLGIPVPPGVPATTALISDALHQLVARWARTRGPFTAADLEAAFGLAPALSRSVLSTPGIIAGHYRKEVDQQEYCEAQVLSRIRRRSLAAVRSAVQAVSTSTFGRFLPQWQNLAAVGEKPPLTGIDGTFAVLEQLAGVRLPASAWENLVLRQRVADYAESHLDELTSTGEILIVGSGTAATNDPWVQLLPTDYAAQLLSQVEAPVLGEAQQAIMEVLGASGGFLFQQITGELHGQVAENQVRDALWELFDLGLVSPDSYAQVRARLQRGSMSAHRNRRSPSRSRVRSRRTRFNPVGSHAWHDVAGRWSATPKAASNATERSVALGEALLERYGVVTRGSVLAENILGGFALAYKVLSGFEESGKALRGHFIEHLGAAQFSTPVVIDQLRGNADSLDVHGWPSGTTDPAVYVLAAADPANPYGAALPWPQPGLSRAAGATVVLADGLLLAHLTRGGRSLTLNLDLPELPTEPAGVVLAALHHAVGEGLMEPFVIEKINGDSALSHELTEFFRAAGARLSPRGIKIAAPQQARWVERGRSLDQALGELDELLDHDNAPGPYAPGSTPRGRWRGRGGAGWRR